MARRTRQFLLERIQLDQVKWSNGGLVWTNLPAAYVSGTWDYLTYTFTTQDYKNFLNLVRDGIITVSQLRHL